VVAFFATYWYFAAQGRAALEVGWIFCFLTIPAAAIPAGALAGSISYGACERGARKQAADAFGGSGADLGEASRPFRGGGAGDQHAE
jgi:hypothetical protein